MPVTSRQWTYAVECAKMETADDGTRTVYGVASSGRLDRQREVVHPKALLRQYTKAVEGQGGLPYLWQHDWNNPIGYVKDFGEQGGQVWTRSVILPAGQHEKADLLCHLLEIKAPFSQSIGFNPADRTDLRKSGAYSEEKVWHWGGIGGDLDFDLMEQSAVTVGANQDANLSLAKGMGFEVDLPALAGSQKSWGGLSTDDIRQAIYAVLQPGSGNTTVGEDWSVNEFYEDAVIVTNWRTDESYRLSFAVVDGAVQVGERTPVTREWVEAKGILQPPPPAGQRREAYEEERFLADLKSMAGLTERTRNMVRHWAKEQRDPSQEVLDQVLRPVSMAAEILRAGRVLSDANRQAVIAARDALAEVLSRDDSSRERNGKGAVADDFYSRLLAGYTA